MNNRKDRYLNGYKLVYDPENPMCMKADNWDGYVYEHVKAVYDRDGKILTKDQVIHHLDFNRSNNHPSNLIVLSIADHGRLHNWINNISSRLGKATFEESLTPANSCRNCGLRVKQDAIYCSDKCYKFSIRKVPRPSCEELKSAVANMSIESVGRKYGVSGNSIRKWLKCCDI